MFGLDLFKGSTSILFLEISCPCAAISRVFVYLSNPTFNLALANYSEDRISEHLRLVATSKSHFGVEFSLIYYLTYKTRSFASSLRWDELQLRVPRSCFVVQMVLWFLQLRESEKTVKCRIPVLPASPWILALTLEPTAPGRYFVVFLTNL